jgi:hypothetical protein
LNEVVKVENFINKKIDNIIQINDKVRVIVKKKTFAKKLFERIWSEDIYIVVGKKGYRYLLELNDKPIEKTYLKRELQKVTSFQKPINISPEEKKTNKANKLVKLQRKENIGTVNEDISVIEPENKRLIPKNEKRKPPAIQAKKTETIITQPIKSEKLAVGSKVSVLWDDPHEWFNGVVKKYYQGL